MNTRTLRGQSAGFWLGVGLVTEAPAAAALALLPAPVREQAMTAVFTSPAWATVASAACLLLYAGMAWLAVKLGLGG